MGTFGPLIRAFGGLFRRKVTAGLSWGQISFARIVRWVGMKWCQTCFPSSGGRVRNRGKPLLANDPVVVSSVMDLVRFHCSCREKRPQTSCRQVGLFQVAWKQGGRMAAQQHWGSACGFAPSLNTPLELCLGQGNQWPFVQGQRSVIGALDYMYIAPNHCATPSSVGSLCACLNFFLRHVLA